MMITERVSRCCPTTQAANWLFHVIHLMSHDLYIAECIEWIEKDLCSEDHQHVAIQDGNTDHEQKVKVECDDHSKPPTMQVTK